MARGDGSFDVTGSGLTIEKRLDFTGFLSIKPQAERNEITAKNAPPEHIKRNVRRVELPV